MESTGQKPENEHRLSHTFSSSDADEHRTLKYHLLGPSLTKAGQDAVDQQKVRLEPVRACLLAMTLDNFLGF